MANGITIEEALYLMESFDSRYKITRDHTPGVVDTEHNAKHRITHHTEYALDDGDAGHMSVWHRNGAYEIHHVKNGKSGIMDTTTDTPNMKFIGTVKFTANEILSSGHPVRIVGRVDNGMFKHYHKIANILAKKHNLHVTQPKQYTYNHPTSHLYNEITVTKPQGNPAVVESLLASMKTRTDNNGYGTIFSIEYTPVEIPFDLENSDV